MAAVITIPTDLKACGPARDAVAVTPNDGADLAYVSLLSIGVAGNVKVTTLGGSDVVIAMPAGVYPLWVKRVWSTSTTATGIVALYY